MKNFPILFLRFFLLGAVCFVPGKTAAQYTHSYSFPTPAGVGFRLTEPAAYDQSFHVKKTGNDNNPGTADQPLATIGKALEKARASLQASRKTKILVYPGTYVESVSETSWNNGDNATKRTLLCLEGQTATGSVVMQPRSDNHHALWLEGKHSLIIRNFIFDGAYQNNYVSEGGALLVTYPYWGSLRERYQDWLVENCEFKNGNGSGVAFHHNEYSTFRNVTVKDNKGGGGSVALRYCLVDGLTLTNNNLAEVSRFSNGGLFWISAHTILRNSNLSGNKGAGLRMDHSCVNSVFENITADNNSDQGLSFETASGPILIKNCRARNNKIGLGLATVYDVVVDGCTFSDNTQTQVEHGLMKRDDPTLCVDPTWYCTSSNYDTAPLNGTDWTNSLGLTSNRRIEMVNNTITTTRGATSYLVQFGTTDRVNEYADPFLTGDYWAANNRYYNPASDDVFGITPNVYVDFDAWRAKTGKESGSIWGTGGPVPAAPALATPSVNGPNSVTITWTDNSGNETGFRVQRKRGATGTYATVANLAAGVTSYTNTGLTAATQYYYRVKAVNDNGTSTSGEATVTTPAAGPGDVVFATNAGGGLVVSSGGTSYEADYHYSGGSTYVHTLPVSGTSDPQLYGPERYGLFSYNVPVAAGTYAVTVHLAESHFNASGQRVFSIALEGTAIAQNLDLFATVGRGVAYDLTREVTVSDGTLNINFTPSVENAAVKAILVKRTGTGTTLRTPENPAGTVAGLDYKYYHGTWSALPNFDALTPVKTGTVTGFDMSVRTQTDNYGFRYTGYVDVPTDGTYTFYTSSDDGSKLYIGTQEVVNNDGLHGMDEKSGSIGLKAGKHAITVTFFEAGGGEGLTVSYSGPALPKGTLPNSALFRTGGTTPNPGTYTKVTGTAFGTAPWSGCATCTFDKAFDGNTATYFDAATADGSYTGIDAGSGKTVTRIRYYPRASFAYRMPGGKFQGSNTSSSSGFVDLYTIPGEPAYAWQTVDLTNATAYRYLRYLGPTGAYGNVAEVEFYTSGSTTPATTTYLSDLTWAAATNGYGPVEKDQSNGEALAGDGRTITLNGTTYAKGLGIHAASEITYNLGGAYNTFLSDVGLDDEVNCGSVVFEVYLDNALAYSSGTMEPTTATKSINLNVAGKNTLRLVVTDAGNGAGCDHADWAGARLTAGGARLAAEGTGTAEAVAVYPNPARGTLTVQFRANADQPVDISLTDPLSRRAGSFHHAAVRGANTARLDVSALREGLYLLEMHLDGQRVVKKVILK